MYKRQERGEFEIFYQPQLFIESAALMGLEALLRWRHPRKGLVAPGVFIPILEECGLIEPVGEWVIRTACRQHRVWQVEGLRPPRVAVNISGRQFLRAGFAETVARILAEEGLAPAFLELEITETVLARETEQCIETLKSLKGLGLEIALDDFGTGYSSLNYLKRFPINTIKLDRSFVSECDTKSEDAAICAAIISLGRTLGLKTIAEGVEQAGQLDFLRNEGCLAYQGFLHSQPMSAPRIAELLRGRQPVAAVEECPFPH